MALPSPSPFSLPLLSLTYIPKQQRSINASRAAPRLGSTRSATLFWGESLPKIHTVGLYIPPAQHTYGGAPSLPYPTTPLTLRSPKPNYGQLTPKGPTWGVLFAPSILGPWASDPKTKKMGVVQFWAPRGHLPFFCSFGLLSISGTPGPPSNYRYPTYRPQTHLF